MELLRNKITVYEASSRRNHFLLTYFEVYFEPKHCMNDPRNFYRGDQVSLNWTT